MRLCFFFTLILFSTSWVLAESITLQTYYPAPTGVYNTMKSKKLCVGEFCIKQAVQVQNNNLYVQEKIGIGNEKPEVGLHIGNLAGEGVLPLTQPNQDMIVSGDFLLGGSLFMQNKTIQVDSKMPAGYVLVTTGGGNTEWQKLSDLLPSEVPVGTLCGLSLDEGLEDGYYESTCMNRVVKKGNCPDGYSFLSVTSANGVVINFCMKR